MVLSTCFNNWVIGVLVVNAIVLAVGETLFPQTHRHMVLPCSSGNATYHLLLRPATAVPMETLIRDVGVHGQMFLIMLIIFHPLSRGNLHWLAGWLAGV